MLLNGDSITNENYWNTFIGTYENLQFMVDLLYINDDSKP